MRFLAGRNKTTGDPEAVDVIAGALSAVPGPAGQAYRYELNGIGGNVVAPVMGAPTTSTTGGSLPASTTFYYKVTALNAMGESMPSTEVSIMTGAGATNSNTVPWTKSAGASGYKIYRGTAPNAELYLATVGDVATYVDDTATIPAGAMPSTNTAPKIYTIVFPVPIAAANIAIIPEAETTPRQNTVAFAIDPLSDVVASAWLKSANSNAAQTQRVLIKAESGGDDILFVTPITRLSFIRSHGLDLLTVSVAGVKA